MIKSTHDKLKCAKDLPSNHVFGLKANTDNDIKGLM